MKCLQKGLLLAFWVNIRELSLFMGWGGWSGSSGNPYSFRESPYLRKRFFTCPFILPKDLENIDDLKFFRPPPWLRVQNLPPSLDLEFEITPKPIEIPENIEFQ